MKILLSALLLGLAGLTPVLAQRPQTVEPGAIETIRLDAEGRAVLRVTATDAGVPAFDLLAGPEGLDSVSVLTGEGEKVVPMAVPQVLAPGRHDLTIQGAARPDGRTMEIQGRLRLDPPLDAFEPNDAREQARRIELPFYQIIRTAQGDPDWFRIETQNGGVIGIHLHHFGDAYTGPQLTVLEADGTVIFQTGDNAYAWQSMRYVRSTGRPIYLGITDSQAWDEGNARAFKALEIVRYIPNAPVNGSLITLGLESEDPSFYQLDLVGEALGAAVRPAGEAEIVASELARAAGLAPRALWPRLLAAGLLLAALAAAGFWYFRLGPGRKPKA
jgi:hypothetical protein